MTECFVDFGPGVTTAYLNDILIPRFFWMDASPNIPQGILHYAMMSLTDPDGYVCDNCTYVDFENDDNPNSILGFKPFSIPANKLGIWTANIAVSTGLDYPLYVYCSAEVNVVPILHTQLYSWTCLQAPPAGTCQECAQIDVFNSSETVVAYLEIEPGPANDVFTQQLYFKNYGQTEHTYRGQYSNTHNYCQWSYWDIDDCSGPGTGFFRNLLGGVEIGFSNIFEMTGCIGEFYMGCIGCDWFTGPFLAGQSAEVAKFQLKNVGKEAGNISYEIISFPGTYEELLDYGTYPVEGNGGVSQEIISLVTVPDVGIFQSMYPSNPNGPWEWILCARCRGSAESSGFPSCPTSLTKVFVYP